MKMINTTVKHVKTATTGMKKFTYAMYVVLRTADNAQNTTLAMNALMDLWCN
jgi:hypothetical protein